ncbi:MAG: hypothetical protein HGGPFJEG_01461 [Ignavibacteria bacterium]|nr:hypothetical protein [Ignavibacteria bacterium]
MTDIKALKPQIKTLFLSGTDVPEICDSFRAVNPSTVYTWIRKEGWRELRDKKLQSFNDSPEMLLQMLDTMITGLGKQVNDPVQVAKIADSISKIVKSIKTLSKDKDRLGNVLFVIGELGKHMNEQSNHVLFDEEFRSKFDKLLESFQSKMILKFNPKNLS